MTEEPTTTGPAGDACAADAGIRVRPAPPCGTLPRLGRLAAVDPRDRRFAMAAPRTERAFRSWLSPGPIWDQGATSQCVAYATNRFLVSHRIVNHPIDHDELYRDCQRNDEWDGEAYDGTSVRAAFKVLQRRGLVAEYHWAFEVEPVVRHLLEVGPVVLGIEWTEDMFHPSPDGYVRPTGGIAGGHAILAIAVNRRRVNPDGSEGAVRLLNSWGPGWGQAGRAWVTFGDLGGLLHGLDGFPGEAATAIEVKAA